MTTFRKTLFSFLLLYLIVPGISSKVNAATTQQQDSQARETLVASQTKRSTRKKRCKKERRKYMYQALGAGIVVVIVIGWWCSPSLFSKKATEDAALPEELGVVWPSYNRSANSAESCYNFFLKAQGIHQRGELEKYVPWIYRRIDDRCSNYPQGPNRKLEEELRHYDDHPWFFHATEEFKTVCKIIGSGHIWVSNSRRFPGSFVSTRAAYGHGKYVFGFRRDLEFMDFPLSVKETWNNHPESLAIWIGFPRPILLKKYLQTVYVLAEETSAPPQTWRWWTKAHKPTTALQAQVENIKAMLEANGLGHVQIKIGLPKHKRLHIHRHIGRWMIPVQKKFAGGAPGASVHFQKDTDQGDHAGLQENEGDDNGTWMHIIDYSKEKHAHLLPKAVQNHLSKKDKTADHTYNS